jgi:hypothetical protein
MVRKAGHLTVEHGEDKKCIQNFGWKIGTP